MFCKVYRAYLIIYNPRLKKVNLSNKDLYMAIGGIMGFDMLLLVIWNVVEPYLPYTHENKIPGMCSSVELDDCPHTYEWTECGDSGNSTAQYMFLLLIFYKFAIMAAGCYLSVKSRNLSTTFAESKQLLFIIYGMASQGLIVLLLSYAFDGLARDIVVTVQIIA